MIIHLQNNIIDASKIDYFAHGNRELTASADNAQGIVIERDYILSIFFRENQLTLMYKDQDAFNSDIAALEAAMADFWPDDDWEEVEETDN